MDIRIPWFNRRKFALYINWPIHLEAEWPTFAVFFIWPFHLFELVEPGVYVEEKNFSERAMSHGTAQGTIFARNKEEFVKHFGSANAGAPFVPDLTEPTPSLFVRREEE